MQYTLAGTVEALKITEVGESQRTGDPQHEHNGKLPIVLEGQKDPTFLPPGSAANVGDYLIGNIVVPGSFFGSLVKKSKKSED